MTTKPKPTPAQVLAVPMAENEADAATIGEYLIALLEGIWEDTEFSGKRPFGDSGWRIDLYAALGHAGYITCEFDGDGYVRECDDETGDTLIREAIASLYPAKKGASR